MPKNEKTVEVLRNLLLTISGNEEGTSVDVDSGVKDNSTVITIKTGTPRGKSLLIGKKRSMFYSLKTIFSSLSGQDRHHYILIISGMRPGGTKE